MSIKSSKREIYPSWVTITLDELGNLTTKGLHKGMRDKKELGSKNICSEVHESIIKDLEYELSTE